MCRNLGLETLSYVGWEFKRLRGTFTNVKCVRTNAIFGFPERNLGVIFCVTVMRLMNAQFKHGDGPCPLVPKNQCF